MKDAEDSLSRIFIERLNTAKASALKHLEKMTKAEESDFFMSWLFDFDEDSGAWKGILLNLMKEGSQEAKKQLIDAGVEWSASFDKAMAIEAVKDAKKRAALLITSINNNTKAQIRAQVAKALEEGKSSKELARVLEDSYTFSRQRAELIAVTETAYADIGGNVATYKAAKVPFKKWVLGSESCDECSANASAGIVDFNHTYSSGDKFPPAHPRCRCDIVPVLKK